MNLYLQYHATLHDKLTYLYGAEAADEIIQDVGVVVAERSCDSLAALYKMTETVALDFFRARERERKRLAAYRELIA